MKKEVQQEKQPRRGQFLAVGLALWVGLSLIATYFVGWLEGIALGSLVLGTSLILFGVVSALREEMTSAEEASTGSEANGEPPPKDAGKDNQSKNTDAIPQSGQLND